MSLYLIHDRAPNKKQVKNTGHPIRNKGTPNKKQGKKKVSLTFAGK